MCGPGGRLLEAARGRRRAAGQHRHRGRQQRQRVRVRVDGVERDDEVLEAGGPEARDGAGVGVRRQGAISEAVEDRGCHEHPRRAEQVARWVDDRGVAAGESALRSVDERRRWVSGPDLRQDRRQPLHVHALGKRCKAESRGRTGRLQREHTPVLEGCGPWTRTAARASVRILSTRGWLENTTSWMLGRLYFRTSRLQHCMQTDTHGLRSGFLNQALPAGPASPGAPCRGSGGSGRGTSRGGCRARQQPSSTPRCASAGRRASSCTCRCPRRSC